VIVRVTMDLDPDGEVIRLRFRPTGYSEQDVPELLTPRFTLHRTRHEWTILATDPPRDLLMISARLRSRGYLLEATASAIAAMKSHHRTL